MVSDHRRNTSAELKSWLSASVKWEKRCAGQLVFCVETSVIQALGLQQLNQIKPILNQRIAEAKICYKDDRPTTVVELDIDEPYILKRYNARSRVHLFSRALRKSRARRSWQRSYEFAQAGINVAAPALMYECRFGPIRLDAYFISEKLSGQELLTVLPQMSEQAQKDVLKQMADVFKKMRAAKLTHGDMKASNILWVDGVLYFIDLDAAKKHLTQWSWEHSHQKDRKRFLKNWRQHPTLLTLFDAL